MNIYVYIININAKPIFFMYSAYLVAANLPFNIIRNIIGGDTRVFWTNLVCSERCWVSIRKQVQITASWLEPFTLKPKRIFALTFWCSIKDGLGIFKHFINWSSLKRGFCNPTQAGVSVSIRNSGKAAFNSSRSWQVGMVVITLKFASNRERWLTHYPWNLESS